MTEKEKLERVQEILNDTEIESDQHKIDLIKHIIETKQRKVHAITEKGKYSTIDWTATERILIRLDIEPGEYQKIKRLFPLIPKTNSQYNYFWKRFFPHWIILTHRQRGAERAALKIHKSARQDQNLSEKDIPSVKTIREHFTKLEKDLLTKERENEVKRIKEKYEEEEKKKKK